MNINYVRFIRGTPTAFQKLNEKNSDTLYFISEADSKKGSLYLGEKLISESVSSLQDLENISFENLQDKNLLSYNANDNKWVNKPIIDAIGLMTGAKNNAQGGAGLVPAPGIGQENLFLRGDGVWAIPAGSGDGIGSQADGKTISLSADGTTIALKDFGIKYYKFIPEKDGIEAHYEAQIVDEFNPWKENLEAKVTIDENGQFILGWFEPNTILVKKVESLSSLVDQLNKKVQNNSNQIVEIKTSISNISDILNKKVSAADVYTKAEIDAKILEAGHLIRKTFQTLEEANNFAISISNPESYVYMVASNESENNKYAEYLYIDGSLELVGSWDVKLENYATKEDLQIVSSTVSNLEALLNNKADKTEIITISNSIGTLNTRVSNIEEFLNSDYFNSIGEMREDLNSVKEAVTWRDLT